MVLLIRNQASFVEQIARNDQERLALERQSDERQRKNDERFARIEERLERIEATLLDLPKVLTELLPQAIKKEIGFMPRK